MRILIITGVVWISQLFGAGVYAITTYNDFELAKLTWFLKQESAERGVMNFEQLGLNTMENINWATVPGLRWNSVTMYLEWIEWDRKKLSGNLDLSDFEGLKYVYCTFNDLKSINFKNSAALIKADLYTNDLRSIDVTTNPEIDFLRVGYNNISSIDLSNNPKLGFFCCTANQFEFLKLSNNNRLYSLTCVGNQLHTLILEDCDELETVSCDYNFLTSLNLNNLSGLQSISCTFNLLNELHFNNCPALESVTCSNNEITGLDFSFQKKLKEIYCERNLMTSLNVEGCEGLTTVYCNYNLLENLDVSSSPLLSSLSCKYNNLTLLTLPHPRPQLKYSYMPQNNLAIERKYDSIDFRDFYNINNSISTFRWTYMSVPVVPLESNEGFFAFDESNIGKTFICQMHNSILPDLWLQYDVTFTQDDTGNRNPQNAGLSVYAGEKTIHVVTASSAMVGIYSLQGVLQVKRTVDAGHTAIPTGRGAYVVVVNDKSSYKVIVR